MDSRTSSSPGAPHSLVLATQDLAQDLATAYEELRVAEEEIRAQQDAIQRLVESHRGLSLQQERTLSILPVPIVVTDLRGMIRSVNAAAAMLVEARVGRLVGKPLFGLFSTADRQDLRRLLSSRATDGQIVRRTATLLTRAGPPLSVEVTACLQLPDAPEGEVCWMILSGRDRSEEDVVTVSGALARLATLAGRRASLSEVLHSAIAICHDCLGGSAELSVALGTPLQPFEIASSSQKAQLWDGLQVAAGEGPSETCYRHGISVTSSDLGADGRWPALGGSLSNRESPAVLSAPIKPGDEVVGTMTAYFDEASPALEETVEIFAVTLGGVIAELRLLDELEQLETDMRQALSSRAVIDQAKGIIMAERGVSADEAWRHLAHISSTQHVRVHDVAERIVARTSGRR